MPKYGIHHIVLKEALNELLVSANSSVVNTANIIQGEMSSAIIGSIRPDLFFWGPDYEIVNKLKKLYDNFKSVVNLYNQIVQPIRNTMNAIGEPVEDLVESLTPQTIEMIRLLLEEIKETSSLFKAAIGTGLFAGVLEGANLLTNAAGIASLSQQFFQMFVPDLQSNRDERQWYWFDMLHYRYTGKFAESLVKNASTARQKSFSFGYLSHIATDVTGHAFVNQVVGTTYRLNVQRHVTAENFMDTWKYYQYYGENINQTLFSRLELPSTLPTDIGDLLFQAFQEYASVQHPMRLPGNGFYTREQIDQTYEVFYKVLELMENQAISRPEEPFSGVGEILSDALDAFSTPPSPPSTSSACSFGDIFSFGLTESSRECYKEFFEQAGNWLNYFGELLVWSFETLLNLIDLLLSLLLSLPISVLLAILYGIQLLCYEIYCNARRILSMNGFLLPEPDELDSSIARNLITPFQCMVYNFKNFPSIGSPVRNNLICPVQPVERPVTAAGFHPPIIESTPDRFINLEPFDEQALRMYAGSNSPDQTRSIAFDRKAIGNAIAFTAWMIQHSNDPNITAEIQSILFANWNLDSDRGYGYLSWRGTIPHAEPYDVDNEEYL